METVALQPPSSFAHRPTGGSAGLPAVIDEIVRRAGPQPNLHVALWTLVWNRGYEDVVMAGPGAETRYDGTLVSLHAFPQANIALVVIDTKTALAAIVCSLAEATPIVERLGDIVTARAVPLSRTSAAWTFRSIASLAFGIDVVFDRDVRTESATEAPWLGLVREALERIRHAEVSSRRAIHAERAQLAFVDDVGPLDAAIRAAREAIRDDVERRTPFTEAEHGRLARARADRQSSNARLRARAAATEREIVQHRQTRIDAALQARMDAFTAALPAFREAHAARLDARIRYLAAIGRAEERIRESKAATDRTMVLERRLAYIARSTMRITAIDPAALQTGDHRAVLAGLYQSVELLYRAIPERHLPQIDRAVRSA
jgi:hypothetical protein